MATEVEAPPPYDVGAPPSYESIIAKLDAKLKANPTIEGAKEAVESLTDVEKEFLASHTPESFKIEADEAMKLEFNKRALEAIKHAESHLQWSAEDCATSCKKAQQDFDALLSKLASISAVDGGEESKKLLDDLEALSRHDPLPLFIMRFEGLIDRSRDSAVSIAHQARDFDEEVVPIALDKTIPKDTKVKKVELWIAKAEGLEKTAKDITVDFHRFLDDMRKYVGRFSAWSTKKEQAIDKEIDQLRGEVADLELKINNISKAMGIVGGATAGVAGIVIPAIGCLLALMEIPVSWPLIIGAIFAVGLAGAVSVASLAVAIEVLQERVKARKEKITELQNEKETIQQTREELKDLGKKLETDITHAVNLMLTAWDYCKNDAKDIKKYLESAEEDINLQVPPYLALKGLAKADGAYFVVNKYLTTFANCLADHRQPVLTSQ